MNRISAVSEQNFLAGLEHHPPRTSTSLRKQFTTIARRILTEAEAEGLKNAIERIVANPENEGMVQAANLVDHVYFLTKRNPQLRAKFHSYLPNSCFSPRNFQRALQFHDWHTVDRIIEGMEDNSKWFDLLRAAYISQPKWINEFWVQCLYRVFKFRSWDQLDHILAKLKPKEAADCFQQMFLTYEPRQPELAKSLLRLVPNVANSHTAYIAYHESNPLNLGSCIEPVRWQLEHIRTRVSANLFSDPAFKEGIYPFWHFELIVVFHLMLNQLIPFLKNEDLPFLRTAYQYYRPLESLNTLGLANDANAGEIRVFPGGYYQHCLHYVIQGLRVVVINTNQMPTITSFTIRPNSTTQFVAGACNMIQFNSFEALKRFWDQYRDGDEERLNRALRHLCPSRQMRIGNCATKSFLNSFAVTLFLRRIEDPAQTDWEKVALECKGLGKALKYAFRKKWLVHLHASGTKLSGPLQEHIKNKMRRSAEKLMDRYPALSHQPIHGARS